MFAATLNFALGQDNRRAERSGARLVEIGAGTSEIRRMLIGRELTRATE